MKTVSLNQFKDDVEASEGLSAVQEALNLDEGNDPSGLQVAQVGPVRILLFKRRACLNHMDKHETIAIVDLYQGIFVWRLCRF